MQPLPLPLLPFGSNHHQEGFASIPPNSAPGSHSCPQQSVLPTAATVIFWKCKLDCVTFLPKTIQWLASFLIQSTIQMSYRGYRALSDLAPAHSLILSPLQALEATIHLLFLKPTEITPLSGFYTCWSLRSQYYSSRSTRDLLLLIIEVAMDKGTWLHFLKCPII